MGSSLGGVISFCWHGSGPTCSFSRHKTAIGIRSARAQAAAVQPQPAAGGQRVKGAARGAAVGAAAGAIGGDAGKGAAAGAAAGTVAGGMRKRPEAREQTAQAEQQQTVAAQGQAGYNKAMASCMHGRGYLPK